MEPHWCVTVNLRPPSEESSQVEFRRENREWVQASGDFVMFDRKLCDAFE